MTDDIKNQIKANEVATQHLLAAMKALNSDGWFNGFTIQIERDNAKAVLKKAKNSELNQ
jgi:hypothetical protein